MPFTPMVIIVTLILLLIVFFIGYILAICSAIDDLKKWIDNVEHKAMNNTQRIIQVETKMEERFARVTLKLEEKVDKLNAGEMYYDEDWIDK